VGSYSLRKGVKYAAPALNKVLDRNPRIQVTFLGTGCSRNQVLADYKPSVYARVNVIPCFSRSELPRLLTGHHIKLLPTVSEGFGMVLPEAMACGLAPIVTSTPGPLEIVQDGHDGIIVPARDPRALMRAVEYLIADRTLLDRLRRNAYVKAQVYSWNRTASQTLQLYEEYIHGRA
jgi:glycosyltransferase involved in cell wall biosynthesis